MHRDVVVVRSSTLFPQSDSLKLDSLVFKTRGSLKLDSLVLKTNSLSFRTHVPLKPDSAIPKTPVNISVLRIAIAKCWHNGGVAVLNSDRMASSVWGAISRNGGPSVSNIDY